MAILRQKVIFPFCAAAKSLQSCLTLCDPIDGRPPGSRPWDSPGKNTRGGCHFLLQCMKVKSESEVAQSCPTPRDPMDCSHQAPPSLGSPGESTGVGAIAFSLQLVLVPHIAPLSKNPEIQYTLLKLLPVSTNQNDPKCPGQPRASAELGFMASVY